LGQGKGRREVDGNAKRGERREERIITGKGNRKMTREVFSVSLHATRSFYRSLLLL